MNIKVIIYWQDGIVTVHSIHMEDLEELLIDMVMNRGKPFLRASILNGSHFEQVKDELFQG